MNVVLKRFTPYEGEHTRAFLTVAVKDSEHEITLTDLKLNTGANGFFIQYPSQQGKDKQWHPYYLPNQKLTRVILEKALEVHRKSKKRK